MQEHIILIISLVTEETVVLWNPAGNKEPQSPALHDAL
jgi:hypothetical protein